MKKFNYAAYKAEWKRRAAHHGIDPETGATGYQVCLVKAEIAKREKWAALEQSERGRLWWADADLWEDSGQAHSETESAALANICAAAKALRDRQPPEEHVPDMCLLRELWREVRRELAHSISLRWVAALPAEDELLDSVLQ